MTTLSNLMIALYGQASGACYGDKLEQILRQFLKQNPNLTTKPKPDERLTQADVVLITYGDQITKPHTPPLQTLADFLNQHLKGVFSGVHILPFFPYSSDDGFSVIDYSVIDPDLGDWEHVSQIGRSFRLMFDAVVNHISAQSRWFQAFLQDDPTYADYFVTFEVGAPTEWVSKVVRPRALPLLTPFTTPSGEKLVWTTFSADQIDLNYANPQVLLDIIKVLLLYVQKGAEIIRLDAIAYLWKEPGTTCIHLPKTHKVVQIFRAVLDAVAPQVLLVTETNVPHEENVSYFGDGANQAQMVYQFSLAPLILNAFHSGSAQHLLRWAAGLKPPSKTTTFFNFTASHDGIGVRPAEGILDTDEFQQLADKAQAHGGFVSFKANPDGTQSPYELNISYFDALSNPAAAEQEGLELQIRRFLASQAIMLSLAGVPGVYIHSLLGSQSWRTGVQQTGRHRTINREKLLREELEAALADPATLRQRVFQRYKKLLRARVSQQAFHPNGPQKIIFANHKLFTLLRTSPDGRERVLCIHNVTDQMQVFQSSWEALGLAPGEGWQDLLTGKRYPDSLAFSLEPYQVLWLKGSSES